MPSPQLPQKPANTTVRESADEKMMKALVHQAMIKVLEKRDTALLAVAQQMIDTGEVKEKASNAITVRPSPEKHLSDDDLLTILDRNLLDRNIPE
jgi:hypothetical protein